MPEPNPYHAQMSEPTQREVCQALLHFDGRQQKIVSGLLVAMMQNPTRVKEREWIVEQLAELTLLTGDFEDETPESGAQAVKEFVGSNADEILNATYLLFQRVGLDLAPRAAEGFGLEDALKVAVGYLPPAGNGAAASEN